MRWRIRRAREKPTSRVSDYFVVDNTPPTIGDMVFKSAGNAVTISLRAQDRTSTIANVEYIVDSNDQWQSVLPVDGIFDASDELVKFSIKGLTAGEHQVTIRATDSHGNQALREPHHQDGAPNGPRTIKGQEPQTCITPTRSAK